MNIGHHFPSLTTKKQAIINCRNRLIWMFLDMDVYKTSTNLGSHITRLCPAAAWASILPPRCPGYTERAPNSGGCSYMDVEFDKGTVRDTTNNQAVDTEQKGMVWKWGKYTGVLHCPTALLPHRIASLPSSPNTPLPHCLTSRQPQHPTPQCLHCLTAMQPQYPALPIASLPDSPKHPLPHCLTARLPQIPCSPHCLTAWQPQTPRSPTASLPCSPNTLLSPLSHCLTAPNTPLPHCLTARQPQYPASPLPHCSIASLLQCHIILLSHWVTVVLNICLSASLLHCLTDTLLHCLTLPLN